MTCACTGWLRKNQELSEAATNDVVDAVDLHLFGACTDSLVIDPVCFALRAALGRFKGRSTGRIEGRSSVLRPQNTSQGYSVRCCGLTQAMRRRLQSAVVTAPQRPLNYGFFLRLVYCGKYMF
jgi:hypothetical protein